MSHRSNRLQFSWYRAFNGAERTQLLGAAAAINRDLAVRRLDALLDRSSVAVHDLDTLAALRGVTPAALLVALGASLTDLAVAGADPHWVSQITAGLATPARLSVWKLAEHLETLPAADSQRLLVGFAPLAEKAITEVAMRLADVSPTRRCGLAVEQFLPALASSMLAIAIQALTVELNVARLRGALVGSSPAERFASFVELVGTSERMLELLVPYPVLARQLMERTEQWRATTLELIDRLLTDVEQLDRLSGHEPLGSVIAIEAGLGDRHRGGRSVTLLTFASGCRVVYKPRSGAAEVRLQRLLGWLGERTPSIGFHTRQLLDRGTYCWDTHVTPLPCNNAAEIARFVERLGGLLAVFSILRGADLHFENVVAHGEFPVVVDAETIFRPSLARPGGTELGAFDHTVLSTGLLPAVLTTTSAPDTPDLSATGVGSASPTAIDALLVHAAGTDHMAIRRGTHYLGGEASIPRLGDDRIDPLHLPDRLLAGFDELYDTMARHRRHFDREVLAFRADRVRVVLRPTRVYGELQLATTHPTAQRDALEVEKVLDHLAAAPADRRWPAAVLVSERRQLLAGDVPVFETIPEANAVTGPQGERFEGLVVEPGLDAVRRRIEKLRPDDQKRERWLIEVAVALARGAPNEAAASSILEDRGIGERDVPGVAASDFLQAAAEIGQWLLAVPRSDGDPPGWIGLTSPTPGRWVLSPAGLDLYEGQAGIVLFLATLGAVTDHAAFTRTAQSVAELMTERAETATALSTPGALSGLAGLAYAFARLGCLWGRAHTMDQALRWLHRAGAALDQDVSCLVSGAAGVAVVAAGIYDVTGSEHARAIAARAGAELRRQAVLSGAEARWHSSDHEGRALTGLAHGAAGIAWALAEVSRVTGDDALLSLATRALAFERALYEPTTGAWPDLRAGAQTKRNPTLAWCHGAPGIGLARVLAWSARPELRTAEAEEEVAIAMARTRAAPTPPDDALCHGGLGLVDVLLTVGHMTEQCDLVAAAHERGVAILRRAAKTGSWRLRTPGSLRTPALLTGVSGIGYALARLAAPGQVPSLLALRLDS